MKNVWDNLSEIFVDEQVPDAVVEAQGYPEFKQEKEQEHLSKVHLFFSYDIVNSTMYKALTSNWPIVIQGLLEDIRKRVFRMPGLESCFLWRVIGDEMIFVSPIQNSDVLVTAVDAIFEVTQRISISLKSGKFFDSLEDQRIKKYEIELLKTQNLLSIKSAAWIAAISGDVQETYDNISFMYSASSQNQIIKEYLGKDIDTGFRLKSYTQDRRLAISFELAYFLINKGKGMKEKLHILDYVRLRGVWNEALYPVIWYYDAKIIQRCSQEMTGQENFVSFKDSFRYDEMDNNPLVYNYLLRHDYIQIKGNELKKNESSYELMDEMYIINTAIVKIVTDRGLGEKLQYINSLFSNTLLIKTTNPYTHPLEMHCAVVCCDVSNRRIMITHRGSEHNSNPGKWEFGCAKAKSDMPIINSIHEYYKRAFGIDIELVMDTTRTDRQPLPIAIYEIPGSNGNIKKGVIFVARIKTKSINNFRPGQSHDSVRWIGLDDIISYTPEQVIPDFHQTVKKVFDNFNKFFIKN